MKELFNQLMTNNMDESFDVEGRPLGEQRVQKLYDTVKTTKIKCHYPGSRFQNALSMNVSALKQVRQNKNEIFYFFSKLRQDVDNKENPKQLTYLDVWEITSRATLLPLFIKLKYNEKIPSYAAGLYKVAFGLISVAMKLTLDEISGKQVPVTPAYLFQCAEDSGELIGSREVCAAPERLIKEVLHSIMDEDPLCDEKIDLHNLDIDGFLEFSKNSVQFHFCFIAYLIYIRNLYRPFESSNSQNLQKNYEKFQEDMKEKQDKKSIPPVSQIEDLLSYDHLKIFYSRLNKKYFPENIIRNQQDLNNINDNSISLNKKNTSNSEVKNAMETTFQYEDQHFKVFDLLINQAGRTFKNNFKSSLDISDIKKAVGLSPSDFF